MMKYSRLMKRYGPGGKAGLVSGMAKAVLPTVSLVISQLLVWRLCRGRAPSWERGPVWREVLNVGHTFRRSVVPDGRYPTKGVAVERHVADGREWQVSGHQQPASRRQFPQKTGANAGRFLGVV